MIKIELIESEKLESKRELPHRNKLVSEMIAFANSKEGEVNVGVGAAGGVQENHIF